MLGHRLKKASFPIAPHTLAAPVAPRGGWDEDVEKFIRSRVAETYVDQLSPAQKLEAFNRAMDGYLHFDYYCDYIPPSEHEKSSVPQPTRAARATMAHRAPSLRTLFPCMFRMLPWPPHRRPVRALDGGSGPESRSGTPFLLPGPPGPRIGAIR